MSEGDIKKYSSFHVTELVFKNPGTPDSVFLSSALVSNVSNQLLSNVAFAAKLTDSEKLELMDFFNKVALRTETELKDILEGNLNR